MSRPAYRHRHVVTFDETNLVGNVYFAHYLHWQGHCRELFLAEHAPTVLAELRAGLRLVTVSCHVDFYAECYALEEVELAMRLREQAGNRVTMEFDYLRGDVLVARGTQTVACLRDTEPCPVPPELLAALAPYR
jgi:enediyne biosynthesis thioesterase